MDRIDLFQIFIQVVDSGSFVRAAEALGRPSSTVSTAVRELEDRLGARLLHRTTRSVSLTSDGKAFYERSQRVVADVIDTEHLFRQETVPTGNIKVDVPGRVGRRLIVPALPDFFARYPDITLELGMTDRSVNLAEEGIDCAVRVGELSDSGLVARKLGKLQLINVASPDYIAAHSLLETPEQLTTHVAVGYASPTTGKKEQWEWPANKSWHYTSMRTLVTVNSAEAYIASCIAGLGMIQIPEYDVQHDLLSGRLQEVMPDFRPDTLPVSILYPHRKHLSRALQVFITWLEPVLKDNMLLR